MRQAFLAALTMLANSLEKREATLPFFLSQILHDLQ
jgi:hypothetical protein